MFGSIAVVGKASVAGSIHPSSEGMICFGLILGAAVGAISQTLSNGR